MVVPAMQLASKIPDMSVQLWSSALLRGNSGVGKMGITGEKWGWKNGNYRGKLGAGKWELQGKIGGIWGLGLSWKNGNCRGKLGLENGEL